MGSDSALQRCKDLTDSCGQDGLKIRGDIHTLMMGDPGVAKSQLLKQVCAIAPRLAGQGAAGAGI